MHRRQKFLPTKRAHDKEREVSRRAEYNGDRIQRRNQEHRDGTTETEPGNKNNSTDLDELATGDEVARSAKENGKYLVGGSDNRLKSGLKRIASQVSSGLGNDLR